MIVKISPSLASGSVTAPPSKSMAHRALLCGALSSESRIHNISYSKDVEATIGCLKAMGAHAEIHGSTVSVGGLDPFSIPSTTLFCNESGSTLRFLIPLCMLSEQPVTLTGSSRLFQRPLSVYRQIAQHQNIRWEQSENSLTVCGKLKSVDYNVPGDVSSQFITGLLYALPLLDADSTLTVTGAFESASYIDLTMATLSDFGIHMKRNGAVFSIPGRQRPAARVYSVEGDCSNAAFLEGFNLLGGNVRVDGLSADTLQGDRVYRIMYDQFDCDNRYFNLSDCPDLGPVMFAIAAAKGGATFTGVNRLRLKESDRIAAMASELAKFGISVTSDDNTAVVHPGALHPPVQPLCGHNDHRVVMALALLCSLTGGIIEGAEAVSKSFPGFFDTIRSLKIGVETL